MPLKSAKIPTIITEEVEEQEEVPSEFETDSDEDDSDRELQQAFSEGKIEPGLNALVACKRKVLVNNLTGLKAKLEEVRKDLPWIERLDITNKPLEQSADLTAKYGDLELKVNREGVVSGQEKLNHDQHDFKREMLFYRQAQGAVLEGIPRLKQLNVKTTRPDDYFAQMLKTDFHMKKVQEHLHSQREAIEKSDRAKKNREMKRMGKQIQHQVLQKRNQEKKAMLNKVKEYQKGKTSNLDLDEVSASVSGKKKRFNEDKAKRIRQKREYKQDKYGLGGKKKGSKRNDKASYGEDFLGLKKRKGPGGHGGKAKNRPGKAKRQKKNRSK